MPNLRGRTSLNAIRWYFAPEWRLKAAQNAAISHRERAREAYADISPIAITLREGGENWASIARYLNAEGHRTRSGGPWGIRSAQRLVHREELNTQTQRKFLLESFHAVQGGTAERRPRAMAPPASSTSAAPLPDVTGISPGYAIAYCRVSTEKQARAGYSIAAQAEIVERFCRQHNLKLLATYTDVERAWRSQLEDRPGLVRALAHAKACDAKLVISRLDRLARNVSVVSGLLNSGASFVAADAPWASEFTLMILSSIASEESRLISARMREVRAAAKASGRVWRHVCNLKPEHRALAIRRRNENRRKGLEEHDGFVGPIALELRDRGFSFARIAKRLNEQGIRNQLRRPWTQVSALHLLRRLGAAPPHRSRDERTRQQGEVT